MAASAWKVYTGAKKKLLNGGIDLDAGALRIKVVASAGAAAVSNFARSTFNSCGTALSFANADAKTLGNIVVTKISAGATTIKFDASNVVFTASGALSGMRYLVIGESAGDALCWSKLSAETDLGAGSTLTVTFNAAGIFTLSGGTT